MAKFGYQGLLLSIFIIGLSACDGAPAAKVDRVAQATSSAATDTPDEPVKNSFANAVSVRLFVKKWNIKEGNKYTHPLGILLGEDQRKKLGASLIITTMPDEMPSCFVPHHFFRYYDARGKQIGELSVCFCCAGVGADGESNISLEKGRMLSANWPRIEALVRELGERTDVNCD